LGIANIFSGSGQIFFTANYSLKPALDINSH
jgi:hypothetical protein